MKGDITYRRTGWFTVEAAVELTPHAWATAWGWRRGAARRRLPKVRSGAVPARPSRCNQVADTTEEDR